MVRHRKILRYFSWAGNEVEDGDMKQSNVNGGLLGHHKTNKLRHPLEIDVHNSSRTYQHMESPYKQSGMSKYSIDADSKQISQASIVPPTFLRRLSSIQVLEGWFVARELNRTKFS